MRRGERGEIGDLFFKVEFMVFNLGKVNIMAPFFVF